MKIKEVQDQLYPCLDERLAAEGFQLRKGRHRFYRSAPIGTDIVQVRMHKHGDLVDVEIYVAVRHDEIEKIISAAVSSLVTNDPTLFSAELVAERDKGQTATIGIQLGNIAGPTTRDWSIVDASDVGPACVEVLEMIHRDAEPYFSKFRTTDDFVEKLARDDRETWKWAPVRHDRAMKAVAAAYVLHDRMIFDRIRTDKEMHLVERNDDFGLRRFKPFAQYLVEHWDEIGKVG